MAFSIITLNIMTFSIMTFSVTIFFITCNYAEDHCGECRNLFTVQLNVVVLSVVGAMELLRGYQLPAPATRWHHGSFYLVKYHKIAKNSPTPKAIENISTDFESLEF
jgi:hypothetical protein